MRGALPVGRRLLAGLRGDRRTLALVVGAPVFLVFLFSEVLSAPQRAAHVLLGVFVFILTYLLTAIGFLRERTAGTLERVLAAPVSRTGLVLGYVLGFGVLAAVQTLVLVGAVVFFLDVTFEHHVALVVLVALLGALTALGIGIVLSLFAESEFQVQQFMPLVIAPQVILGEVFVPVEELPWYLAFPARLMPVTYIVRGLEYAVLGRRGAGEFRVAVAALAAFAAASILLAAAVVRRVE
ncbi:ABC transporter permease [Halobacteriales archaeon SW_12_69_24]|nr:MAG: ABC transporter permease [Halobacteriales archaeon SW_12_69_24]